MSNVKMGRKTTWNICYGASDVLYILKHQYLRATLVYLLFLTIKGENCPLSCTCIESTATVTCHELEEPELPLDVPQWVSAFILRESNVSTLVEGAFSSNGTELELMRLLLPGNNIQVIEAYAFVGLPRLQLLDLSRNQLMAVSFNAFSGLRDLRYLYLNVSLMTSGARQLPNALATESLRNLQRLELSGNQLKTIPIARFDTLNLNTLVLINNSIEAIGKENISSFNEYKKIRVYLSSNPFKCACELEALYLWLKNGSQCADSSRLVCSQPEGKRGIPVEKLRREDVDCINADLEAVSYVFLGIVLALIGVVFLMVLYLNRGGIKRWLNNIREACRDQMEVYHYRYEQDSDPRLANVAV